MLSHRLPRSRRRRVLAVLTLAFLVGLAAQPPAPAVAQALGDLVVSRVALSPALAQAGGSVTATITVANRGKERTPATTGALYIAGSETATLDTAAAIATFEIASLAPWASVQVSVPFTVPQVAPGTFYVIAEADPSGAVSELSETNNRGTARLQVVVPDLAVSSVSVTPGLARAGESVSVKVSMRNAGQVTTVLSRVALYVTTNSSPALDGLTPLATGDVPSLRPRASAASPSA